MSTGDTARIPSPPGATFESTVQGLRQPDPVAFVADLAQRYGDIVRLPFDQRDIYLLNHPDFIREMFIGRPESFGKRINQEAETAYLNQIGGFAPLFDNQMTVGYAPMIVEAAQRTHQRWQSLGQRHEPATVDMYREMMQITLEITIQTLYQEDATAESAALVEAISRLNTGYGFDPIAATLGELMPPVTVALTPEAKVAKQKLMAFMHQLVDSQKDAPAESRSLIPMLIKYLGSEPVPEQALLITFAMHEVSATTLPWAWSLLSQYPEVDARLHQEVKGALGGRLPTYQDLPNLSYSRMVLDEARRLYPAVWIVGRFVRNDVFFGDYLVPADSIVMASQRIMHQDPRYFPDPRRFDPSRWSQEVLATRPKFAFFPFSAGPRECMGKDFAEAQDALVLAALSQHWQARLVPGQKLEPVPQKSDTPRHGIRMTLHHR